MLSQILLTTVSILFAFQLNAHANLTSPTNSNDAHQTMEGSLSSYDLKRIQDLPCETVVTWFICPKLRLTKEDIQNLVKNSFRLTGAEGLWTMGDFEVVAGKEHLAFLFADEIDALSVAEQRVGANSPEYHFLESGQALLVEKGHFNNATNAFEFTYRWPGDSERGKIITLRLSNISIKDPLNPIPQYLKNLMENPAACAKPVQHYSAAQKAVAPQTVIVQQPPQQTSTPVIVQQPAPAPQTIIVEEVHRHPYYAPPPVVIGGWGWHHHRHW